MKETIKEFIELIANSLLVITLMLASFLVLINVYHYIEVNTGIARAGTVSEESNWKTDMEEKLAEISRKLTVASTASDSDVAHKQVVTAATGQLQLCVKKLTEGALLTGTSQYIYPKDIYVYNEALAGEIQNQCFLLTDYYTKLAIEKSSVKYSYEDLKASVANDRSNIVHYSEYLKGAMLGNSDYFYSTDVAKATINNSSKQYFSLTVNNYNILIDAVDRYATWCLLESGGSL